MYKRANVHLYITALLSERALISERPLLPTYGNVHNSISTVYSNVYDAVYNDVYDTVYNNVYDSVCNNV